MLGDTWQWQLSGDLNTSYTARVYDVDLFDTPTHTIHALQAAGKKVVCYFSAGSSENWRPDFQRFLPSDLGKNLDEWMGEQWLDTRSVNVREIIKSRLLLAVQKGCNAVEPDNVDAYANKSGWPLTAHTQLEYNIFLANQAHNLGLSIGLKNNLDQLADLVDHFDFAVNEQCHEYQECNKYKVFIEKGKPVFNAEYDSAYRIGSKSLTKLCADSKVNRIHTLVLDIELDDSLRIDCLEQ
ncbi:endo alpha-1,4 polygalactosaminidase [Alcaligenaceae bacterium]|nr:endo alpha-1,4 polygalactosaminidase [Alcaligenaceae bacterium]